MAVGIPVPLWLCDVFSQTVGTRTAERLLPLGMTFNAHMAKEIRLVDGMYDSHELMKEAALTKLEKCFKVDQNVRRKTMSRIRRDFAFKMKAEEELDCGNGYFRLIRC